MEIKNATQFVNFIVDHKLQNLHPSFNAIVICLNDYKRFCVGCSSVTKRDEIYNNCNQQYEQIIKGVLLNFTGQFLSAVNESRISFYKDEVKYLGSISR